MPLNLFKTQNQPSNLPSTPGTTSPTENAEEVVIDLDAKIEAGKPDADINDAIPLPPAGQYILKAVLQDKGETLNPKPSQTKETKRPYLGVYLELSVVDEGTDFHDLTLTDYINSLVQKQRQTSDVHHFMNCIGETLPSVISLKDMITRITNAIGGGKHALVPVLLDWKAGYADTTAKNGWKDVCTKMTQFPKDPEGDGFLQNFTHVDANGVEHDLRAQLYVSKYLLQQA